MIPKEKEKEMLRADRNKLDERVLASIRENPNSSAGSLLDLVEFPPSLLRVDESKKKLHRAHEHKVGLMNHSLQRLQQALKIEATMQGGEPCWKAKE